MTNNTTQAPVSLPQPPFGGTDPQPPGPKITNCEVGPFRLPGVKVDLNQYKDEQIAEMTAWTKENHGYVNTDTGLFSWRKESLRDWFTLRWG